LRRQSRSRRPRGRRGRRPRRARARKAQDSGASRAAGPRSQSPYFRRFMVPARPRDDPRGVLMQCAGVDWRA
jgi:hypothetical protein